MVLHSSLRLCSHHWYCLLPRQYTDLGSAVMATFSVRVRYDGVHAARQRGQCVWGMTVPVGHLTRVCEAGVVWICRAADILRYQNFWWFWCSVCRIFKVFLAPVAVFGKVSMCVCAEGMRNYFVYRQESLP